MAPNVKQQFDADTQKNIDEWLNGHYGESAKEEIRQMLENPTQAVDAFYTHLSFGTGGLRGIMGVGTNRMNEYTVRAATQGLANYLNRVSQPTGGHAVFIGYDSRHHSRFFAEESAKVLAANGIRVYICLDLRPTPLVSFGCRYLHCTSAIMVTASHNPPVYNGYKVYWNDGAQILPPHDKGIIEEVAKIRSVDDVKFTSSLTHPLINWVDEEVDNAYLDAISTLQLHPEQNLSHGEELKVVFSNLHGTGATLAPQLMSRWGFSNCVLVDEQVKPDGDFPTVEYPNPEELSALKLGIEKMQREQADIFIATDPDADRVGLVVRHKGEPVIFTGNQVACVCLEHICSSLSAQGRLPEKAAFIKTLPTTELFAEIVKAYKRTYFDVNTGFKYIAEKIRDWELAEDGFRYIFGGEESYGYLFGTFTRDKDAVSASALICEAALQAKLQGKTLVDKLHELFQKHGVHVEELLSLKFPETKAGKEQMAKGMAALRANPPKEIAGIPVAAVDDYQAGIKDVAKTNTLGFRLQDGSKLLIRPSGTEPKIKIYCGIVRKQFSSIEEGLKEGKQHADKLLKALAQHLTN